MGYSYYKEFQCTVRSTLYVFCAKPMIDLFLGFLLSADPTESKQKRRAALNLARQSLIANVPLNLPGVEGDLQWNLRKSVNFTCEN